MKKTLWAALLILLLFSSPLYGGTKEELIRLQQDVLMLQKKIEVLQKIVDERNETVIALLEQLNDTVAQDSGSGELIVSAIRAQTASLDTTISTLGEGLEKLSLKMDETNNRVAALQRKVEDSQVRMTNLRTPLTGPTGTIDAESSFFSARTDYQMGNYELAVAGFQEFLVTFPESELADNAAYFLGDSYLKQDRPELALQAFDQVINMYPEGDRVPVAYYKKARLYIDMQRMEEAVDALKKLTTLFPDSQEARLAEDELSRLGLSQ